ncbi:MAG: prepilin peptidase [Candidatus Dormibacteria bacterium]|jgi:leader peptidase (prepilin peptidase)/N-methyltransferase
MTAGLDVILVVFGTLAGAVAGSFAGVVRARGWRGAARGRSCCEGCHRELRWYELVPVASYAVQSGRCRSCRAPIGRAALWVELLGAAIGAGLFLGVVGLASLPTR